LKVRGRSAAPHVRASACGNQREARRAGESKQRIHVMHRRAEPALQLIKEPTMNKFGKSLSAMFVAVTLVAVGGCASTAQQEGTGEYVDDSVITTKVKTAIFNEPTLKVAEINVETFKGVVQLSGFVKTQSDVGKASEVARGVGGVKSVKNDIRIK
jgi:hyperosmotically inducible protein